MLSDPDEALQGTAAFSIHVGLPLLPGRGTPSAAHVEPSCGPFGRWLAVALVK